MQTLEFKMDRIKYREYFVELGSCTSTKSGQVAFRRGKAQLWLLISVFIVALVYCELNGIGNLMVNLLVGIVLNTLLIAFVLPALHVTMLVKRMEHRVGGPAWYKLLHRVWLDERCLYHQVGDNAPNQNDLSTLLFVKRVRSGGVVIRFRESEDYLPARAFNEQVTAKQFCDAVCQAASALAQQELKEKLEDDEVTLPDPSAHMLRYTVEKEQVVDLLCEANRLIVRSKPYRPYIRKTFWVMAAVCFFLWCLDLAVAKTCWFLLALGMALYLSVVFNPGVARRLRQSQLEEGRLDHMMGQQALVMDDQGRGFSIHRKRGKMTYTYQETPWVLVGKLGIYLQTRNGRQCIPIPMSAFVNEEHRDQFVQEFRRMADAAALLGPDASLDFVEEDEPAPEEVHEAEHSQENGALVQAAVAAAGAAAVEEDNAEGNAERIRAAVAASAEAAPEDTEPAAEPAGRV